jgi:hypothetical protein
VLLLTACEGTVESPVWGPGDTEGGAGLKGLDDSSGSGFPSGNPGAPGVPGSTAGPGGIIPGGPGVIPGTTNQGVAGDTCTTPAVGPSPLRRLTRAEYNNSVADLLGDTTKPASQFAADTQVGLFDNTAKVQTVPDLLAEQYLDSAVTLAQGVKDINALVGCDPASGAACVRGFVQSFGRRAFRRPLTNEEVTGLVTIYDSTKAVSDAATGVRGVVAATLASPNFLFRPEFGSSGTSTIAKAKPVSPYELAGRLAGLLWASTPDDELLDAAESGQLQNRAQVETQARRMLADPRARQAVSDFYYQWFGIARIETTSKDGAIYPEYDDALRDAMIEESRRFIDDVLWNGDAKLSTLLSASYSFVNGPLAKLYGVPAPKDPTKFEKTELDPDQRAGVMTQASMLAAYARPDQSSPVKRGQWVRVRMLCQDLPDPPANVPQLPEPKEGTSNRERFAMHTSNPACSGCHNLIDGLGFGLEHYDGLGKFRTMDEGVPVDSRGEITQTPDINQKYDGAPALADILAGSDTVRDCAPTQWLRFALGRHEDADDTCSLVSIKDAFASSGGDLKELMIALTQTDAFWHYRQAE